MFLIFMVVWYELQEADALKKCDPETVQDQQQETEVIIYAWGPRPPKDLGAPSQLLNHDRLTTITWGNTHPNTHTHIHTHTHTHTHPYTCWNMHTHGRNAHLCLSTCSRNSWSSKFCPQRHSCDRTLQYTGMTNTDCSTDMCHEAKAQKTQLEGKEHVLA